MYYEVKRKTYICSGENDLYSMSLRNNMINQVHTQNC